MPRPPDKSIDDTTFSVPEFAVAELERVEETEASTTRLRIVEESMDHRAANDNEPFPPSPLAAG
jgi:hypothetical protein